VLLRISIALHLYLSDTASLWQVEFNGSSANNIISTNVGGVLLDKAEQDASRRWKMFGSVPIPGGGTDINTLNTWFSHDGLKWGAAFAPNASREILTGCEPCKPGCKLCKPGRCKPGWCLRQGGDTHNNLYRIMDSTPRKQQFGAVTRLDDFSSANIRSVGLSTISDNFSVYTKAKKVLSGVEHNQTYGMQVAPWEEAGVYVGLLAIYASGSTDQKVSNELAISYDGLAWERVNSGSALVPHGAAGSFDSHTIYSAKPLVDPQDGSIRVYYSGGNGPHSGVRADCIGLARFHTDGFAGWTVSPASSRGAVRTRAMGFTSEELRGLLVNAVVERESSLVVQVLDSHNGSIIATSQTITSSVSDGGGENLVWREPPSSWASRRSCVLQFTMIGDITVFSFVTRGRGVDDQVR
jgi:hypothetical protein